jgi:hypothetical protein
MATNVFKLGFCRHIILFSDGIMLLDEIEERKLVLDIQQISKILHHIKDFDIMVDLLTSPNCRVGNRFQHPIGKDYFVCMYARVKSIDIRVWQYSVCDKPRPTNKGMKIHLSEWPTFKSILETIRRQHPDIASTVPCYLQPDHANRGERSNMNFLCLAYRKTLRDNVFATHV